MGVPLLERSRELGGVGNRRQRRWGHPLLEELGGGRARPRVSGMIRRTGPRPPTPAVPPSSGKAHRSANRTRGIRPASAIGFGSSNAAETTAEQCALPVAEST
ncbi:hypothetical protein GCM10010317_072060 [Streptomyces mirabilis]|nr:hypothetical protein GCM10010317_072060 [Streptomyces mirabilis]